MWSETIGLRTRHRSQMKKVSLDLGLGRFGLSLGLAGLVCCVVKRNAVLLRLLSCEGHSNFLSTIYSFTVLYLEHHYYGDQSGVY